MERRIRGKDSEMKGIVNLMLPYLGTDGLLTSKRIGRRFGPRAWGH